MSCSLVDCLLENCDICIDLKCAVNSDELRRFVSMFWIARYDGKLLAVSGD